MKKLGFRVRDFLFILFLTEIFLVSPVCSSPGFPPIKLRFVSGPGLSAKPNALTVADLDNDGWLDLLTLATRSDGYTLAVLRGKSGGEFLPPVWYKAGDNPHHLSVGDLNEDGFLDVLTFDLYGSRFYILYGEEDGEFAMPRIEDSPVPRLSSAFFLDLDEDGHLDIILGGGNRIRPLWGDGRGNLTLGDAVMVGETPLLAFGDMNLDGRMDLIVGGLSGKDLRVVASKKNRVLQEVWKTQTLGPVVGLAVGDFNTDEIPDIAAVLGNRVALYRGEYGRGMEFDRFLPLSSPVYEVMVGNLNGDSHDDLICLTSNSLVVWQNDEEGFREPPLMFPGGEGLHGQVLVVADLNRDGPADVLSIRQLSDRMSFWINETPPPPRPAFLPSGNFTPAEVCGRCHQKQYQEWRGSIMAFAALDPVNTVLNRQANEETKGLSKEFCLRCHSPVGFLGKEILPPEDPPLSEVAKEGITCDFCHRVTHSAGIGNAFFYVGEAAVKYGPRGEGTSDYHFIRPNPFLRSSEFCGTCHDVTTRDRIIGVPMVAERTYSEWRNSRYAQEGVTCQSCHMRSNPTEGDNPALSSSTHYFPGIDLAVIPFPEQAAQRREVTRLLKTAATVDLQVYQEGRQVKLIVPVTNTGTGHFLPSGTAERREIWLEVLVEDAQGRRIYGSGLLDPVTEDLIQDPDLVMYKAILRDAYDRPLPFPWLPWQANPMHTRNKRIPPDETVIEEYSFTLPQEVVFPLKVRVRLRARQYPPLLMRMLGLDYRLMIVDIDQSAGLLFSSGKPKGDVNGDKMLSAKDGGLILKHILGLTLLTKEQQLQADLDDNGQVNLSDLVLLLQKLTRYSF